MTIEELLDGTAAVYAASEGLDVLVLESNAPGGQAGSSSRIENYLGFPSGISGQDRTQRAFTQAQKFGAELLIAEGAVLGSPLFWRIARMNRKELEKNIGQFFKLRRS